MELDSLEEKIADGTLHAELERELTEGFQAMQDAGVALPPASHYAARIAEIMDRESPTNLSKEQLFDLYQEVLLACENARRNVLGEEKPPVS